MKTLSREGIQRMTNGAGGGSVSGGGISSSDLAGLATQVWVNQNYLSIDFFSSLFKAYGPAETQGDPDVEIVPNDTESTISNIKAMFGFWTDQYISALGQGSGGGGGGASALTELVDVAISNPTDGQVLKYNATTHKWYNGNDEGLTSLAWSQITDKPTTLAGYGITDAYTKTEADGRYLKLSGGTMSNTNVVTNMNADLLDGQHLNYIIREDQSFDFSNKSPISGYIIHAGINSINPPSNICGGNQYTVIQVLPYHSTYGSQLAIGFGTSYLAWRNRQGTTTWGDWQKIKAGYADSAGSATNADTVDGFHASGLLQEMTYDSGVLGIKIGNTTMSAEMYKAHHRNNSNGGTNGWLKMVTINVSQVSYKNQPFRFFITQRNKKGALLTLLLSNGNPVAETNPYDYVIVAFSYQGEITKAIVTTDSANVFSIWIQKSEAWDNVSMSLINYDIVYMNGAIVSYQDGFQTSDPSGTEAVMDTLTWSQIANKPTTLSGYGITDAYTKTETDNKFLTIAFFRSLFKAYTSTSAEVVPNSGDTTTIASIKAMFGFWTEQYISALGQNSSGGGGGGASALTDLTDVEFSGTPSDGQVLKYNGTTHKWYNGTDEGLTSLPWSSITGKPTTLSGYGITDAYISSGTIYLGGNSITPLTSFTETDPTVPAWAKAASKPSYSFSELTGTVAFSQLPTMYWADVAVSNSSNNNTSPQFGNLRLRPGSDNYGSYLRFGDGDYAYLAELSDDQLTYRAGSHTFNVSNSEAVQINSSGLRIGGSSGVVLSWDSTNNALKVQKADGTAANLYATGGVSALGLSGGSGGSIGNLRVTGTLNIGSSFASLYCSSNNYLYVDAPRIYFNSTLYMGSNNIRTESGNIYTEEGNIYLDGGYIYLDSSHYIYLDGSTLKFYDGSTAKTIYTY